MDVGRHLVRALLRDRAPAEEPPLANAEPRLQTDCVNLVRKLSIHVADRRGQPSHPDQPRCVLIESPLDAFKRVLTENSLIAPAGHHKCREDWPDAARDYERAFNLFLDGILLVIPLIMLAATYALITRTLWQGMRTEKTLKKQTAFESQHSCKFSPAAAPAATFRPIYVIRLLDFIENNSRGPLMNRVHISALIVSERICSGLSAALGPTGVCVLSA